MPLFLFRAMKEFGSELMKKSAHFSRQHSACRELSNPFHTKYFKKQILSVSVLAIIQEQLFRSNEPYTGTNVPVYITLKKL